MKYFTTRILESDFEPFAEKARNLNLNKSQLFRRAALLAVLKCDPVVCQEGETLDVCFTCTTEEKKKWEEIAKHVGVGLHAWIRHSVIPGALAIKHVGELPQLPQFILSNLDKSVANFALPVFKAIWLKKYERAAAAVKLDLETWILDRLAKCAEWDEAHPTIYQEEKKHWPAPAIDPLWLSPANETREARMKREAAQQEAMKTPVLSSRSREVEEALERERREEMGEN